MSAFRIQTAARARLAEILAYGEQQWGRAAAEEYVRGLFEAFQSIADRKVLWRTIPAEFEVDGFYRRYKHHYIYFKVLTGGDVGIATVLHERMHLGDRLREDVGS